MGSTFSINFSNNIASISYRLLTTSCSAKLAMYLVKKDCGVSYKGAD